MAVFADTYGIQSTASSQDAVDRFAETVSGFLRFTQDIGARHKATFDADPDMLMAHVFKGMVYKYIGNKGMSEKARKVFADCSDRAVNQSATAREKAHIAALGKWCDDDLPGAAAILEEILIDHPTDVLAIKVADHMHFYTGQAERMAGSTARVLPCWDEEHPDYGYILGTYAFGLEESGNYVQAEYHGRAAVDLNPEDAWAVHAVAHVMEMQGRHREGINWVKGLEPSWSVVHNFRNHLHWHRSLYHLELNEFDEVLDIYDRYVSAELEMDFNLDLCNAAAMLWRLELYGVDIGDRWSALVPVSGAHVDDEDLVFVSLHYLMALIGAGEAAKAAALLDTMKGLAEKDTTQGRVAKRVGVATGEAMQLLKDGQHSEALSKLWPIRYDMACMGGSHAQRDVFEEMIADAALKSETSDLARAHLAERVTKHPTSPWTWSKYGEALSATGYVDQAEDAHVKSEELLEAL